MFQFIYKIFINFFIKYTCSVCLNEYYLKNFHIFNCGHVFCESCKIYFIKLKCPICSRYVSKISKIIELRCITHLKINKYKYLICLNCGIIFCMICLKLESNINGINDCEICKNILQQIFFS